MTRTRLRASGSERLAHSQQLGAELFAADGTQLAYSVTGAGPALALSNGVTTDTGFWRYLQPRWAARNRVLMWDLPGHGASGPAGSLASARIDGQPELLCQLMDAAGMDAAVQVGWSTGCQVVLEMARRHPQRCLALVLLLGASGHVLSTAKLPLPGHVIDAAARHMPQPIFGLLSRAFAHAAHAPLGQLVPRRLGLIGGGTSRADASRITAHLRRIDTRTVQVMIASAQAHSASDLLPSLRMPVLIVAGDRDPFAPADAVGVAMHARCPGAELVRLPEGTHTALLDHADVIGEAVDDFLRRRVLG